MTHKLKEFRLVTPLPKTLSRIKNDYSFYLDLQYIEKPFKLGYNFISDFMLK